MWRVQGCILPALCHFSRSSRKSLFPKDDRFDAFGLFPEGNEDANNKAFIRRFSAAGGDGIGRESLVEVLAYKGFCNCELIQGDICGTIPQYVLDHPELKVALLHVDVDVYEPTKVILEQLFSRVVKGGLVVFDDYGTVAGETRAIDEFLEKAGRELLIEKLPISHIPAYIRK